MGLPDKSHSMLSGKDHVSHTRGDTPLKTPCRYIQRYKACTTPSTDHTYFKHLHKSQEQASKHTSSEVLAVKQESSQNVKTVYRDVCDVNTQSHGLHRKPKRRLGSLLQVSDYKKYAERSGTEY